MLNGVSGTSVASKVLYLAAGGAAVIAGMPFSPYFDPALFWLGRLAGPALGRSMILFYGTTIIIALVVLAVAAAPASIARRFVAHPSKWLVGGVLRLATALAIAWPAIRIMAGAED